MTKSIWVLICVENSLKNDASGLVMWQSPWALRSDFGQGSASSYRSVEVIVELMERCPCETFVVAWQVM